MSAPQKLNSSFVKDAAEIVRQIQQASFDDGWVATDRALTHDLCIISDLSRNLTYKLENLAAKLKQEEIEADRAERNKGADHED